MKSHADRLDFHWTPPAMHTTRDKNRTPSGPSQSRRVRRGGEVEGVADLPPSLPCTTLHTCIHLLNDHHENTNIMVTYRRSILLLRFLLRLVLCLLRFIHSSVFFSISLWSFLFLVHMANSQLTEVGYECLGWREGKVTVALRVRRCVRREGSVSVARRTLETVCWA